MAATKRQYRRKGRKGGRRRGRKGRVGKTTNNNLMGSIVRPDRMLVRLPYNQGFALTSGPGLGTSKVFNLNSIYDPDRSGIGHQPLGFDEWATFYNKYRVFKVGYIITFQSIYNAADTLGAGHQVGIVFSNGSGITSIDDASFEQPHVMKGTIGNALGNSTKTFKGYINLPRVAGRSAVAYKSDPRYGADFGFNPNEYLTCSIMANALTGASPCSVSVSCRFVYYTELYDPAPLNLSNTDEAQRGPDPNVGNDKDAVGYKPTPIE